MEKTKEGFLKYSKNQGMTKAQEDLFNKEYDVCEKCAMLICNCEHLKGEMKK